MWGSNRRNRLVVVEAKNLRFLVSVGVIFPSDVFIIGLGIIAGRSDIVIGPDITIRLGIIIGPDITIGPGIIIGPVSLSDRISVSSGWVSLPPDPNPSTELLDSWAVSFVVISATRN